MFIRGFVALDVVVDHLAGESLRIVGPRVVAENGRHEFDVEFVADCKASVAANRNPVPRQFERVRCIEPVRS